MVSPESESESSAARLTHSDTLVRNHDRRDGAELYAIIRVARFLRDKHDKRMIAQYVAKGEMTCMYIMGDSSVTENSLVGDQSCVTKLSF